MPEHYGEGTLRTLRFLGVLAVIVIIAEGLTAYHLLVTSAPDARLANMPIPVQTVIARVRSVDDVIGASGALEPRHVQVNITNKVVSNVLRVPVDEGLDGTARGPPWLSSMRRLSFSQTSRAPRQVTIIGTDNWKE